MLINIPLHTPTNLTLINFWCMNNLLEKSDEESSEMNITNMTLIIWQEFFSSILYFSGCERTTK